jgi:hypothetical protein
VSTVYSLLLLQAESDSREALLMSGNATRGGGNDASRPSSSEDNGDTATASTVPLNDPSSRYSGVAADGTVDSSETTKRRQPQQQQPQYVGGGTGTIVQQPQQQQQRVKNPARCRVQLLDGTDYEVLIEVRLVQIEMSC